VSVWQVLGVDPTSDKKTIKRAYVKCLKTVNPEENQEGFMALRGAYEQALDQADCLIEQASHDDDGWEERGFNTLFDEPQISEETSQRSLSETLHLQSLWGDQTNPEFHWQIEANQREQDENESVEILEEQLLKDLDEEDAASTAYETAEPEHDIWQASVLQPQQIHETVMMLNKACNALIEQEGPLLLSGLQALFSRSELQHPNVRRQVGSHVMVLINQILEKDNAKCQPSVSPDVLIYLNRFFSWSREVSIDWDAPQSIVDKLVVMAESAEQRVKSLEKPWWKRGLYVLFYPYGRITRRETLFGFLFWISLFFVEVLIDELVNLNLPFDIFLVNLVLFFCSSLFMSIKRLADTGESYRMFLLVFFPPYIGLLIFFLYLLLARPKDGIKLPNPRYKVPDYVHAYKVLYSGEITPEVNPLEGSPA